MPKIHKYAFLHPRYDFLGLTALSLSDHPEDDVVSDIFEVLRKDLPALPNTIRPLLFSVIFFNLFYKLS